MKKILVITEKPSMVKFLEPTIKEKWADSKVTLLAAPPYYQTPVLPSHIPDGEFYIREPVYAPGKGMLKDAASGTFQTVELDTFDLKQFDEIIFAQDPDHSGVISFKNIIDHQFDADIYDSLMAVKLIATDEKSIERAFANMGLYKEEFADQISYGEVKRYFDWHWTVNSAKFLSPILDLIGTYAKNIVLSKYTVQLLFFINNNPGKSEGQLIGDMSKWPSLSEGSVELGSAASKAAIIENLLNLGLVNVAEEGNKRLLSVSLAGEKLIGILSEHMDDKFMPSKIEAWGNQGIEKAKPEIDAYLGNMFNDQIKINAELNPAPKKAIHKSF